MDSNAQTQHSKFLSLVLRHQPELIGLRPDAAGWIGRDDLLVALAKHDHAISPADLDEIVATSPKRRFAFSDDGTRIRASQGHSFSVDLGLEPMTPPNVLFHGTVAAVIPAILAEGLQKQQRHHVHLSADVETAKQVGGRRGKPVILEVAALQLHGAGHAFYRSANGVWLTDSVPAEFLREMK